MPPRACHYSQAADARGVNLPLPLSYEPSLPLIDPSFMLPLLLRPLYFMMSLSLLKSSGLFYLLRVCRALKLKPLCLRVPNCLSILCVCCSVSVIPPIKAEPSWLFWELAGEASQCRLKGKCPANMPMMGKNLWRDLSSSECLYMCVDLPIALCLCHILSWQGLLPLITALKSLSFRDAFSLYFVPTCCCFVAWNCHH